MTIIKYHNLNYGTGKRNQVESDSVLCFRDSPNGRPCKRFVRTCGDRWF